MRYIAPMDATAVPMTFWQECGLTGEAVDRLAGLSDLYASLLAANERDNLTRITDATEFSIRHVADSLLVGRVCPPLLTEPLVVADVGCGGGFPLLPLAQVNPALRIVGIESRRKKVAFVESQINALRLANASAVSIQAREAGRQEEHAGRYQVVLLRAVGEAGRMLREVRHLVSPQPGSSVIYYKTPDAVAAEWSVAQREATKFGFTIAASEIFQLPGDGGQRQFIVMTRP